MASIRLHTKLTLTSGMALILLLGTLIALPAPAVADAPAVKIPTTTGTTGAATTAAGKVKAAVQPRRAASSPSASAARKPSPHASVSAATSAAPSAGALPATGVSPSVNASPTVAKTPTVSKTPKGSPSAASPSSAAAGDKGLSLPRTSGPEQRFHIETVTPLTITVNNQTKGYGAAMPTLTVSYTGFTNGDTASDLDTPPTVVSTGTIGSAVGSYSITASGAADTNYSISYVAGTLSVTPAPLTITANNQTKQYGATVPALTASYSGFVNGNTSASLSVLPTLSTTANAASPVTGSPYAITASGAVSSNYAISYVAGSLSVTPAPLTITADNQSKAFGGALPTLTASYTGFVNGDTAASLATPPILGTTADATSAVGVYPVTASGAVDANYAISYVAGSLTVTAAPLTITADNQSKVYGAVVPALTASYTGFVNGDTAASLATPPILGTTADATSAVGVYPVTASGAVDANYAISYVAGSLTVTAAPLMITADNQSKVYGAVVPALTASYTGFVNGDTAASLATPPILGTTADATSAVGVYPVTASGAVDANYAISYVAGSLTVTAAPLMITADNQSKVSGAALPALTVGYSGFVNGDTSASLTTPPTTGTTADANSAAGTYAITVSGAAGSNYTISYVAGTLTVTAAVPVPGAPGGAAATPGDGRASVTFTPSAVNGGSVVTGYTVTSAPGAVTGTCATSPCLVTGLTNGTSYTFTVHGTSSAGDSPESAASNAVIPRPVPAAPGVVTAVAGASSVTVSWPASSSVGVTGYTVSALPGPATCTTSSAADVQCVIGATSGQSYTYTVVAHSAVGDSAASAPSAAATPTAPAVPSTAPTNVPTTLTTTEGVLSTVSRSQSITIVGTGFLPYSTVVVLVYSSPTVLATAIADGTGAVSVAVTVPAGLAAGAHTFAASGTDATGAVHQITMAVTLAATTVDNGTGAAPGLPVTGPSTREFVMWAVLFIIVGAFLEILARRRRPIGGKCG